MQARRRTDILAAIVLVLAPAGLTAQSTQPSPAPAPTPSLFDPRRPPARELETRVPDGFTLAAVGDLITTRPLVQTLPSDPGFAAVVKILRDADTAYGNFETTAIDLGRFAGQSYAGRDDWPLAAPPEVARDLRALGFDFVSRANNHAMDYGIEGMRETSRWLEDAGIVYAGIGESRGDARAARYLELPTARIGLVSMASTYRDYADALPAQGRAPGRPGINALRTTKTYVVTPETLRQLRAVKDALEAPSRACERPASEIAHRKEADAKASEELTVLGTSFRAGTEAAVRYAMNPIDLEEILGSVRLGKQHSDLLVATIHSHDTGLGCEEPGDFLPVLARAAIDAGAGVFIGTGEHRLMPIEIYRGPADLLQPRELLLGRHAGAAARRHPRGPPRRPREGLRREREADGRGPECGHQRGRLRRRARVPDRRRRLPVARRPGRRGAPVPRRSRLRPASHEERHAPPRLRRHGPLDPRAAPAHLEALRDDDRDRRRVGVIRIP